MEKLKSSPQLHFQSWLVIKQNEQEVRTPGGWSQRHIERKYKPDKFH